MCNQKLKISLAIPGIIILIVLGLHTWATWGQWGQLMFIFPMIVIDICVIYNLMMSPVPEKLFFDVILASKNMTTFLVPGIRLLTEDYEKAKKGPTGYFVPPNALLVLLLILTGTAFFSTTQLFVKIGFIPAEWYLFENKDLWVYIFIVSFCFYIILTSIVNWITSHIFSLGYKIDSSIHLMSMANYLGITDAHNGSMKTVDFNGFWTRFSYYLENIYGHKVWGGQGISAIIDAIRDKRKDLGTSQWFILEFAADLLERHVSEENLCIKMSYDNPEEYSHFLARTMQYCSKNIIWIVDQDDFTQVIFPVVVREVLLSIVQQCSSDFLDSKDMVLCKSLSEMANKDYNFASEIKGFCSICIHTDKSCKLGSVDEPCSREIKEDEERIWIEILKDFEEWAIKKVKLLDKESLLRLCIDEKIWDLCKKRCTDALGFPHIRAFYKHNVPKSRIIELPTHPDGNDGEYIVPNIKEDTCERILDRIRFINRDTINDYIHKPINEKISILADEYVKGEINSEFKSLIYIEAWRIFNHLSNNETQQEIVGFAEVRDINSKIIKKYLESLSGNGDSFDIGLYDNNVMVNSWQNEKSNESRFVTWTILLDGHEIKKALAVFDPEHECKPEDKNKVFLLSDFISSLEKSFD